MTRLFKRKVASVGIGAALALMRGVAAADPHDDGTSGAAWWQWTFSIPVSVNPSSDQTGAHCMIGQRGDAWYLGSILLASGEVTRECAIPEGTTLFFPVMNFATVDTPNICGQGASIPVKELRASVAPLVDALVNPTVTVDGVAMKKFKRMKSDVFFVALPDDNVFNIVCGPGTFPADVYGPAVDDGIYAQVNGLNPGAHHIDIHAENPLINVTFDIHYNLDVVATKKR